MDIFTGTKNIARNADKIKQRAVARWTEGGKEKCFHGVIIRLQPTSESLTVDDRQGHTIGYADMLSYDGVTKGFPINWVQGFDVLCGACGQYTDRM